MRSCWLSDSDILDRVIRYRIESSGADVEDHRSFRPPILQVLQHFPDRGEQSGHEPGPSRTPMGDDDLIVV